MILKNVRRETTIANTPKLSNVGATATIPICGDQELKPKQHAATDIVAVGRQNRKPIGGCRGVAQEPGRGDSRHNKNDRNADYLETASNPMGRSLE